MTVKELIDELKKYDEDKEIGISISNNEIKIRVEGDFVFESNDHIIIHGGYKL